MRKRFDGHVHTEYSNLRLLDSINHPKDLINRAIELGLSGIAITDHEALCAHIDCNQYAQEIKEKYPDFKVALGNEIYLRENRENGGFYYHFILIAKNKIGYRALRELSTRVWLNSYEDRRMERVVTLYSDLEEIVNKYPGTLIASSACLGGFLSKTTLALHEAECQADMAGVEAAHNEIVNFILWCKKLFGNDFYIECAPGQSREQIIVNRRLASVAEAFNCKMVLGSDAHYLKKEDRYVHEAFLKSKEDGSGSREVASFYEYAYLQSDEEVKENIAPSGLDFDTLVENSYEIYQKIENFSLFHKQKIPSVEVPKYPKREVNIEDCPTLTSMFSSDNDVNRYWVNKCFEALKEKGLDDNEIYIKRLEEEADVKQVISEKLETNMFAYPVTLEHYINLFWDCDSLVGAGRGSSCAGLNHYLLGITQLDPIKEDFKFFRYLNKDRIELGDVDLDLCPSRKPIIVKKVKEERGKNFLPSVDSLSRKNLGCTLIATFGTQTSKSAVLTACRGYRSEEFPDGIDSDTAQYLASLIPIERGFVFPIKDVVYGNEDKDRKPITAFVTEVEKYPRLLEIILGIEGIIDKRSSHASGVIMTDEDPYEFACFMRTPKGEVITQWDLHQVEWAGHTKYDWLITDVEDKLRTCIKLLQASGKIDPSLTLRQVYDQYFHPYKLPINSSDLWRAVNEGNILNFFQFDSEVGAQAIKKVHPDSLNSLIDCNGS